MDYRAFVTNFDWRDPLIRLLGLLLTDEDDEEWDDDLLWEFEALEKNIILLQEANRSAQKHTCESFISQERSHLDALVDFGATLHGYPAKGLLCEMSADACYHLGAEICQEYERIVDEFEIRVAPDWLLDCPDELDEEVVVQTAIVAEIALEGSLSCVASEHSSECDSEEASVSSKDDATEQPVERIPQQSDSSPVSVMDTAEQYMPPISTEFSLQSVRCHKDFK